MFEAPPLPKPPAIEHLLYEAPLPGILMLVAAAVIAFWVLNRAGKARIGGVSAIGLLVIAAALWFTARGVTTTREVLQRRTTELVDAVAAVDLARLSDMLDPRVTVKGARNWNSKDRVLSGIESTIGSQHPIESHSVLDASAVLDGPNIGRTQPRVRVRTKDGLGALTTWRLTWYADEGGTWRALEIEYLAGIPGVK